MWKTCGLTDQAGVLRVLLRGHFDLRGDSQVSRAAKTKGRETWLLCSFNNVRVNAEVTTLAPAVFKHLRSIFEVGNHLHVSRE